MSRNCCSVTSPSFSFSAAESRPLLKSKPIEALKTAVSIDAISYSDETNLNSNVIAWPLIDGLVLQRWKISKRFAEPESESGIPTWYFG